MSNFYNRVKDMPNQSKGLLSCLRRNPYGRVWAYVDHYYAKDFVTLKKLRTMSLREMTLRIGSPTAFGQSLDTGSGKVRARAFSGTNVKSKMFMGRSHNDVCLVGIGTKGKPVWMIDVTDRFIEELNTVGACAVSKAHCQFEQVSPRIKQCPYCGDRLKMTVEVQKNERWYREE